MSTLANARNVLKLMAQLQRDLTVTDVASELDIPKSSASRTLGLMADYGFLERDDRSLAYRPGALIMEASYHFRSSHNAHSLLEEELDRLVEKTGYAGYVNLLDGDETLVIHMRTGRVGSLQAYTPIGTRGPASATSTGRALLARLDDTEVADLVGTTLPAVGSAPRSRKELLRALATIRADGWSISRGEYVPEVAGLAAAVMDPASRQLLGIGIALPAQDLTDDVVSTCGTLTRDAAMRVGKSIGDPYWLGFEA